MFASLRQYKGSPVLADELVKRQDEIKAVLRPIPGLHAYYLVKTNDGAVSMTVCEARTGAEESNRVAANWIKEKLPKFASFKPEITTGEVRIQLEAQPVRVKA
jgi:hypothetical protein